MNFSLRHNLTATLLLTGALQASPAGAARLAPTKADTRSKCTADFYKGRGVADVKRPADSCYTGPAGVGTPIYTGPVGVGTWTPINPNFGGPIDASQLPDNLDLLVSVPGTICSSQGVCSAGACWGYVLNDVDLGNSTWCEATRSEASLMRNFYINAGQAGYTASSAAAVPAFTAPMVNIFGTVTQTPVTPVSIQASDWTGLSLYGPGGAFDQAADLVCAQTLIEACNQESYQPIGGGGF